MDKKTKEILRSLLLENRGLMRSRRRLTLGSKTAKLVTRDLRTSLTAGLARAQSNSNFKVEVTMPDGVRITRVKIDEVALTTEEMEELERNAEGNVVTAELDVPIVFDEVLVDIEFVGDPNISVPVKIFYDGDAIYDDSIEIDSVTGRGAILASLSLP